MRVVPPNVLVEDEVCGGCEAPLWVSPDAVVVTYRYAPEYAHVELTCDFCGRLNRLAPLSYVDSAREMGCQQRRLGERLPPELRRAYKGVAGAPPVTLRPLSRRDVRLLRAWTLRLEAQDTIADLWAA